MPQNLPILQFPDSRVSIISRIPLKRFTSNSGSLSNNLTMTGFQSSNPVCKLLAEWLTEFFTTSTKSAESDAFNSNLNNTDTTSGEKEGYKREKLFNILLICFLGPEVNLVKYVK